MAISLLRTKFYIPPVRPDLMSRPRLIQQLNAGLNRKLTLVSAPAGYGKTTLLSEWVHRADLPVAWLSLDKEDNDPTRFLTYTIAALQTINAEFGGTALALLQSPQPPPTESVLTALINDIIEASGDPFTGPSTGSGQNLGSAPVLILDDYHVIEAQAVDNAITFLLDHLPPPSKGMHLIIAGRTDPSLSLARLRAGSQLTEIRVDDLRFTRDEVAAFMEQALRLNLSEVNVAALENRTEGWIAGLQLAALSMQGQHTNHISGLIQAFTGSHRYIVDYLVEQVLKRRPPGTRSFLLQTSILNRLTGPLCDAVRFGSADMPSRSEVSAVRGASHEETKGENSQTFLEALEAANLFIVPLDHERRWYRYHHLFADMLRQQLRRTQPELVSELDRRASAWYAENGFIPEAVNHALAAEDFEWAARLIEPIGFLIMIRSEWATLSSWLDAMPAPFVRTRPRLLIFQAWMLRRAGQYDAVEALVQDAERALGAPDTPVRADEKQVVRAHIASLRAYIALFNGEIPRAIEFAHQALEYFPPEDMIRGVTSSILGIASRMSGDLVAAEQAFAESRSLAQASDNVFLTHIATWHMGYTQLLQGRLHQAAGTYRKALELAAEQGDRRVLFAGQPHVYLGAIMREWNELDVAETHLKEGVQLCGPTRLLDALTDGYAALARVYLAQGNLQAALAACRDAQRMLQVPNPDPVNVVRVDDCRIRLWLAQGDLAATTRWARESGLSVDDEIHFKRELEHINLARVLVAQGIEQPRASYLADARNLLARLLEAAETAAWMGKTIEILVLQALALHAQGQTEKALFALERSLSHAEREGYVRVFVDEGAPMATLLSMVLAARRLRRQASSRGTAPDYVTRLLTAFEAGRIDETSETKVLDPSVVAQGELSSHVLRKAEGLIEPLSARELEVLQLIAVGLTNRQIAMELTIAVSTVKTHVKNIHAKLRVRNRTQAVARARELDLLP